MSDLQSSLFTTITWARQKQISAGEEAEAIANMLHINRFIDSEEAKGQLKHKIESTLTQTYRLPLKEQVDILYRQIVHDLPSKEMLLEAAETIDHLSEIVLVLFRSKIDVLVDGQSLSEEDRQAFIQWLEPTQIQDDLRRVAEGML